MIDRSRLRFFLLTFRQCIGHHDDDRKSFVPYRQEDIVFDFSLWDCVADLGLYNSFEGKFQARVGP
jgi:hypothetical protein